ncbi:MAG: NAD(P)H-hydrate dehydratase [Dysgonamonadaceae bacterium]|nr:NAD(P)H-hydrate dehydratase [Dysgonamonadaceae bacterium]
MKIFTSNQVQLLDSYTIARKPISPVDLIERAAKAFVHAFENKFPANTFRVTVFAGAGNNGGDALAIARILAMNGYRTEAILYNPNHALSPGCETNKKRLRHLPGMKLKEVSGDIPRPAFSPDNIVIDGLLGSGLNRTPEKAYIDWFHYLRTTPATVVAVDIPSGLFGEDNTNTPPDAALHADWTLAFQFPRLAFFFPENETYVGQWQVLDIGLSKEAIAQTPTPYYMIEKQDISRLLKKRSKFAHKGHFGHALLIAGSYGKMGAAVLAAKACLRTGTGLLTVHAPETGMNILQTTVPEAMVSTCANGFPSPNSQEKYTALGIGPGIGTKDEVTKNLLQLLQDWKTPLVLDADALNILSTTPDYCRLIPPGSILTPHPGEFDRLAGSSITSWQRLHKAMKLAVDLKSYIILKGAYSAICTPEGDCRFNLTGNPGMATAGSGDVLTGILLSLLAQGYTPEEATMAGVYLHGLAADLAVASGKQSQESLIAGDIVDWIGKGFSETN